MPHLHEELSAYISGELDEQERRKAEEHLAGCNDCMEQLQKLQRLDALLGQLDELEAPPDFVQEVLARAEQERKVVPFRARRGFAILLAAAVIAFFAFLLSRQNQTTPTPPAPPRVVKKPEIHPEPQQKQPVVVPAPHPAPQPVESPAEDPELIAHLEELQNMELIRDLDNLDNLDLAMMMAGAEEVK